MPKVQSKKAIKKLKEKQLRNTSNANILLELALKESKILALEKTNAEILLELALLKGGN